MPHFGYDGQKAATEENMDTEYTVHIWKRGKPIRGPREGINIGLVPDAWLSKSIP